MPIGGILTQETMNEQYLAGVKSGYIKNSEKPGQHNIFFDSINEKNKKAAKSDPWEDVSTESEHKLQKLLVRKRFRMKA